VPDPLHFLTAHLPSVRIAPRTRSVNEILQLPDVSTLSPADGATVTSETPDFSWDQVTYPGTIIYCRLEINDEQNKPV